MLLLNPRRTRTNMKLLQLVWIFLLTLCGQSDPILKPRPEIEGASPLPYITFNKSDDEVLLWCEVRGSFPEPEVEWRDGDGSVLAVGDPKIRDGKGNKYDCVLNVTVNKAGFYRCVATQKEIYHQVYTEAYVPHPGPLPKISITNLTETEDGVLLQCEVLGASPEHKVFWKNRAGNLVLDEVLLRTKTGGGYDLILQTTVKRRNDSYICVTTEGRKDDEIYSEIFVPSAFEKPRSSVSGLVPAAVVALLGLVASVVV